MSLINISINTTVYADEPRNANPKVKFADLSWSMLGLPTGIPRSVPVNLQPQETSTLIMMNRAISYNTSTSFDIAAVSGTSSARLVGAFGQRTPRIAGDEFTEWHLTRSANLVRLSASTIGASVPQITKLTFDSNPIENVIVTSPVQYGYGHLVINDTSVAPADGDTVTFHTPTLDEVFTFRNTPALPNDVQIGTGGNAGSDTLDSFITVFNSIVSSTEGFAEPEGAAPTMSVKISEGTSHAWENGTVSIIATTAPDSSLSYDGATNIGGWSSFAYSDQSTSAPQYFEYTVPVGTGMLPGESTTVHSAGFGITDTYSFENYTMFPEGDYLGMIKYGFINRAVDGGGTTLVMENRTIVADAGADQPGDVFKISNDGDAVTYYKNDILIHTSTNASTGISLFPIAVSSAKPISDKILSSAIINTGSSTGVVWSHFEYLVASYRFAITGVNGSGFITNATLEPITGSKLVWTDENADLPSPLSGVNIYCFAGPQGTYPYAPGETATFTFARGATADDSATNFATEIQAYVDGAFPGIYTITHSGTNEVTITRTNSGPILGDFIFTANNIPASWITIEITQDPLIGHLAPVFSGMTAGDGVTLDAPFNIVNRGDFTIVAVGSDYVEFINEIAQDEVVTGQVSIYSSGPVQAGDYLDVISSRFSYPNRGKFKLLRVTGSFVEFSNPNAVPETGVTNVAANEIVIYPESHSWLLIAVDRKIIVRLNGDTGNGIEVEPPVEGDLVNFPGLLLKRGKIFRLELYNPTLSVVSGQVLLSQ